MKSRRNTIGAVCILTKRGKTIYGELHTMVGAGFTEKDSAGTCYFGAQRHSGERLQEAEDDSKQCSEVISNPYNTVVGWFTESPVFVLPVRRRNLLPTHERDHLAAAGH